MKKRVTLLSLLIFLAVGISILKVIISAATSTAGIDFNNIQAKEALLEEENTQISQTVYKLSSLNTIDEQAKQLGFISDPKSTIVIGDTKAFALKQ